MSAAIGDNITVHQSGATKSRHATVVDIRDPQTKNPTYLVEWADNGHRQLVVLGPGSTIEKH